MFVYQMMKLCSVALQLEVLKSLSKVIAPDGVF